MVNNRAYFYSQSRYSFDSYRAENQMKIWNAIDRAVGVSEGDGLRM
jgi:hypothetical protein